MTMTGHNLHYNNMTDTKCVIIPIKISRFLTVKLMFANYIDNSARKPPKIFSICRLILDNVLMQLYNVSSF